MTLDKIQSLEIKDKPYNYRVRDNRVIGLSIHITPKGDKRYVYRFYFDGKQPTINIGNALELNYEEVIGQVQSYNEMVRQGLDPRKDNFIVVNPYYKFINAPFKQVAQLWYQDACDRKLNEKTLFNYRYVIGMLNEYIGTLPIDEIKTVSILTTCKAIQDKYSDTYGLFARRYASMIFRFGMTYDLCKNDPTIPLKGQIRKPATKSHPAITDEVSFKKLLIDMRDFIDCSPIVYHALNLLPYVFVRSTDLRLWRWEDIDFDLKQWVFTPSKRGNDKDKMVDSLIVPLADSVLLQLNEVKLITQTDKGLVFPSPRYPTKPLGETTMLKAFHRMGYKHEQCVHGFRACAKTLLMERDDMRYTDFQTEIQLGHQIKDSYGRAYNRMEEIKARTRMMSDWATYLDEIKQASYTPPTDEDIFG